MAKISVIIPVYNTEDYIDRCLRSVVNQSLKDIEIIVLNDGSSDKSEDIILKYCKRDKRIRYYRHNNIGLGPTRNRGIELAKGEYLSFIDSDDFIDEKMLETLYLNAKDNNADIVCCEVYLYNKKIKKIRKKFLKKDIYSFTQNNYEYFYKNYYFNKIYSHNAWDKIYKAEIIKANNIKFGDNKRIFAEDNFFQFQILQYAKKIMFLNEPLYYYYIRPNSIMNQYKENLVERHLNMIDDLNNIIKSKPNNSLLRKVISLIAFDSIKMEAINVIENDKGFSKFSLSFDLFKNHKFYKEFLEIILDNKAFLLEPDKKRRYFLYITSIFMRLNLNIFAKYFIYLFYKYKKLGGNIG